MVQELLTSERLCLSRDQYGATPLHKAVLYYQPKLVKLIADKFRIATRAKDQVNIVCNFLRIFVLLILLSVVVKNPQTFGAFVLYLE